MFGLSQYGKVEGQVFWLVWPKSIWEGRGTGLLACLATGNMGR